MSYVYDQRKRPQGRENTAPEHAAAPGPDFSALMAGTARPTAAQKGTPFDLDAAVKAKMENAFGDLSGLKFYKSRAVGDAGAEAIAQGNEIAFAPGMADFSTRAGQERLGHELSHVTSQRSGQVRGQGFLASASLEARADREGAMAAAGEQVYTGPVSHALSAASPSPMAAGVMQAKRKTDAEKQAEYQAVWDEDKEQKKQAYIDATQNMTADDINAELNGGAAVDDKKRPWEITEEDFRANHFNPTGDRTLAFNQAYIDYSNSPGDAYENFSSRIDEQGELRQGPKDEDAWNPVEVDPKHFKAKLKNMLRMVSDYPELKGKVGNMSKEDAVITVMSAGSTYGGTSQAGLSYNSSIDSMSWWGRMKHALFTKGNRMLGITNQSDMEYTGTHELGHVLNSLLFDPNDKEKASRDWDYSITANSVVDAALKNVMSKKEYNKLKRFKKDETKGEYKHLAGQIDLSGSKLYKKGHTSRYGQVSASEFFAEAFADVYSHGEKAKPASIAVVKEYEKRRDEMKRKAEGGAEEDLENSLDLGNKPEPADPLNSAIAYKPVKKKKKKRK